MSLYKKPEDRDRADWLLSIHNCATRLAKLASLNAPTIVINNELELIRSRVASLNALEGYVHKPSLDDEETQH